MRLRCDDILRSFIWFGTLLLCSCPGSGTLAQNQKSNIRSAIDISRLRVISDKQSDPDTAIMMLNDILQKAIELKDNFSANSALLKIGEKYIEKGDCTQGLNYMKRALPYCTALKPIEKSNDYQHIGSAYVELGDYVSASQNFYTALDYYKKSGITSPTGLTLYNDLGTVYLRLHQNEKTLSYINEGESFAIKNNYQNAISLILLSKGEYYTAIHQADSAGKIYERAIAIADRISRNDIKAMANEGLGKALIESGQYEKAIKYLQVAIDLSKNRFKPVWIESSFYLGQAWYNIKKYNEAEKTLHAALKEASDNKLKDNMIAGYTTLTAVYKATGQYEKALSCMDSISVLKGSLVSADNARAINLMDIKFQTAEKDKQIAQQNSKLARKNMWILAISGSVILLLLLSGGFYLYTLNKQRSSEKENKIDILNAAVSGGDNERTRVARDLHDGIGGMLSAAMMRFSSMHHDNAAVTQTAAYREAMDILREMGDEIRKTAHNLMPDILLKQSLPEAVRAYCNIVREGGAITIDFQSYGSFDGLSEHYKLNLYRIIQELVKNIIQHAGASHAMVQLLQNGNNLIISVEDNGAGFDDNLIKAGLGLYNTQTRVSSLDGKFTLDSTPRKGTSVFIEIEMTKVPINKSSPKHRQVMKRI